MTIHLPKVNGFGGGNGGGGGSSSFPTIVTDSGSSLPVDLSGYSAEDTFLDTSTKKIYKAEADGYIKNTNTTITCTIDYYTGIAKNFGAGSYGTNYFAYRSSLSIWGYSENIVDYAVKFKVTSLEETPIFSFRGTNYPSYSNYFVCFGIGSDNKIYQTYFSYSTGSYTKQSQAKILDTEIVANTVYILNLRKQGNSCIAQLTLENGTVLEEKTFEVTSFPGNTIQYGTGYVDTGLKYSGNLEVYLLQSSGELLVPNTDLSWDSGTDITDKTEYADKTNGILYLYEDTELIQIPLIDLSNYKLKATTTTIDTASVTISEIKANTNYVFSNNAITDITLSGCETSFEETSIEFTLPADISNFSFTDNSGITWVDGSPTFNASKSYLIVIFNKLGFVKEY